jgi:hypothetical protein
LDLLFIKKIGVKEQCLSVMIFFTPGKTAAEIYVVLRLSSEDETVGGSRNV